MTYGVGLLLEDGLVLCSDSRTHAGVDHVAVFNKMHVWETPGERVMTLLTAGNLAISQSVVNLLTEANAILASAQVQVGYRVRDEVALFVLHARDLGAWFRTRTGEEIDPIDLALHMKLLPRLAGGSGTLRRVLLRLLGWAVDGKADATDEALEAHAARWESDGRKSSLAGARLPKTAGRLCLMWDRLQQEGFTSYWL